MVHPPHLDDSQKAEKQGVEEHQNAVTEALLDRVQIVGVKAHEISYLIDLVVFLREHAAVVEHLVAEIGLRPDRCIEEADAPQETAENHGKNDPDHRQTDLVQQNVHGESHGLSVNDNLAAVGAVDHHAVELRHFELKKINQYQCGQSEKQKRCIFEVIPVDILSEYHLFVPLL